jgi:hypothetical protein
MDKNCFLKRLREIRLTKKRTKKRIKRKYAKSNGMRRQVSQHYLPTDWVRAPEVFSLAKEFAPTVVKFLTALRKKCLEQKLSINIDFRATNKLFPEATLLLYAEIDRILSIAQTIKPITCVPPQNHKIKQVFKQIGLFDLTSDQIDVLPVDNDVIYWQSHKGLTQSGDHIAPFITKVAKSVFGESPTAEDMDVLWRPFTEVINNTTDHAYEADRGDGFEHSNTARWWMFTHLRNKLLTVGVCDLGMGYWRTHRKYIGEEFISSISSSILGRNRDCKAIQIAMQYGVSGTDQGGRGKGSRCALSLLDSRPNGSILTIVSNTGLVRYKQTNQGNAPKIEHSVLDADILGTIVYWNIPVS